MDNNYVNHVMDNYNHVNRIVLILFDVVNDSDVDRLYGFVRVNTGDEMSKRVKFALITWVGPTVGALNRAKMSTDKMVVKNVIKVSAYNTVNIKCS